MATDKHEQTSSAEMIEVFGELRPRNRFYIAVAEQAARNAANGGRAPREFNPIAIEGEPLSQTIIRDRGPY